MATIWNGVMPSKTPLYTKGVLCASFGLLLVAYVILWAWRCLVKITWPFFQQTEASFLADGSFRDAPATCTCNDDDHQGASHDRACLERTRRDLQHLLGPAASLTVESLYADLYYSHDMMPSLSDLDTDSDTGGNQLERGKPRNKAKRHPNSGHEETTALPNSTHIGGLAKKTPASSGPRGAVKAARLMQLELLREEQAKETLKCARKNRKSKAANRSAPATVPTKIATVPTSSKNTTVMTNTGPATKPPKTTVRTVTARDGKHEDKRTNAAANVTPELPQRSSELSLVSTHGVELEPDSGDDKAGSDAYAGHEARATLNDGGNDKDDAGDETTLPPTTPMPSGKEPTDDDEHRTVRSHSESDDGKTCADDPSDAMPACRDVAAAVNCPPPVATIIMNDEREIADTTATPARGHAAAVGRSPSPSSGSSEQDNGNNTMCHVPACVAALTGTEEPHMSARFTTPAVASVTATPLHSAHIHDAASTVEKEHEEKETSEPFDHYGIVDGVNINVLPKPVAPPPVCSSIGGLADFYGQCRGDRLNSANAKSAATHTALAHCRVEPSDQRLSTFDAVPSCDAVSSSLAFAGTEQSRWIGGAPNRSSPNTTLPFEAQAQCLGASLLHDLDGDSSPHRGTPTTSTNAATAQPFGPVTKKPPLLPEVALMPSDEPRRMEHQSRAREQPRCLKGDHSLAFFYDPPTEQDGAASSSSPLGKEPETTTDRKSPLDCFFAEM